MFFAYSLRIKTFVTHKKKLVDSRLNSFISEHTISPRMFEQSRSDTRNISIMRSRAKESPSDDLLNREKVDNLIPSKFYYLLCEIPITLASMILNIHHGWWTHQQTKKVKNYQKNKNYLCKMNFLWFFHFVVFLYLTFNTTFSPSKYFDANFY